MKWGVLSTGRIARKFINSLAASSSEQVVAVASRDRARCEVFAREMGVPRAYGSYAELLADPDVEVIYNALPNALHAEWTIAAARMGKHVLCEKPMAVSEAEAEQMFGAAREAGVWVMEAFMYRFHPQTRKVQELLDLGTVGEVRFVRTSFSFVVSDSANTRLSAELAGGALLDVGCYCVNFARMAIGARPTRVSAMARWTATDVDATLVGTLEYPDGPLAVITCSLAGGRHHHAQIVGSKGIIELDAPFNPTAEQPTRIKVVRNGMPDEVEYIEIPATDHFRLEAEGFARLIAGGHNTGLPEMPLVETLDNLATIEALLRSAREGGPITLAAASQLFNAPPEATAPRPHACSVCGGSVKKVVLIENHGPSIGEKPAEVAPGHARMSMGVAYNDRYPIDATACTRCGHIDLWVDPEWVGSLK